MVHFVGAGPGAKDLITIRGKKFIEDADMIIYAGSLINPELLEEAKPGCILYDSAKMTLEEVAEKLVWGHGQGMEIVRLHTGDASLYGAVREQMDILEKRNIAYDSCPGVSSLCGAASVLNLEYTLPEVSQSVIITRAEGRTAVPERESIRAFAAHEATMVLFLSAGLLKEIEKQLIEGGYAPDTPAAVVYKATWPEEKFFLCTVGTLFETAQKYQITKTALIIVGEVLSCRNYERSRLYHPEFTTEYRKGKEKQ